jgi:hypothetical protein
MTDLEDAEARVHSAQHLHGELCAAKDRGEPVDWLIKSTEAEWRLARAHLATLTAVTP